MEIQNTESTGLDDLKIPVEVKTIVPERVLAGFRKQVVLESSDWKPGEDTSA